MKLWQTALVGALSVVFAVPVFGQGRDHYFCYQAKSTKKVCAAGQTNAGEPCADDIDCSPGGEDTCVNVAKPPKAKKFANLTDTDRPETVGEDKTFEIKKPKHLCVPVDKNGEGITDPDTSYVSYQIKQSKNVCNGGANDGLPCKDPLEDCGGSPCVEIAKFDKKATDNTGIVVGDQFSNLRIDAGKVVYMMAPASVCAGIDSTPCPDPAPVSGTEDHFKCYAIKPSKKFCGNPGDGNFLEACSKDEQCTTGEDSCMALPKFAVGFGGNLDDAGDIIDAPGRAFSAAKPVFFCKAVQKTFPANGSPEAVVNPLSRLLCYKGKAAGQCGAGSPSNEFGICKEEEHCGGTSGVTTHCVAQAKFDKEDPDVLGFYVNDQFDGVDDNPNVFDHYRFSLGKEDMFCNPACEFSPYTLRATALEIPTTGNPGDGFDVDANASTCQPEGNCSGGIDNSLGGLVSVLNVFGLDLNDALQDAIDEGDINVMLNIDNFANGTRLVTGHTGDVYPGCADQSDPNEVCFYEAACSGQNEIVLPVDISDLPASPASVESNGSGTFGFSIPFEGIVLNISVHGVQVEALIHHTAGTPQSGSGTIGGAIIPRQLKNSIASIPGGICVGGASNDLCPTFTCASGTCLPWATIAGLIDGTKRDIDTDSALSCEGGTNNGEACTLSGCCDTDPNDPGCCSDCSNFPVTDCDPFDGASVGLVFSGIDAQIGPNAAP
jgi:hypothetical protein